MPSEIDELAAALGDMLPVEHENEQLTPAGQRLCPICSKTMVVEEYNGIDIDTCPDRHGIWLDSRELLVLLTRVRSGERIKRRRAITNARRDGKLSALALGGWSLWFDD